MKKQLATSPSQEQQQLELAAQRGCACFPLQCRFGHRGTATSQITIACAHQHFDQAVGEQSRERENVACKQLGLLVVQNNYCIAMKDLITTTTARAATGSILLLLSLLLQRRCCTSKNCSSLASYTVPEPWVKPGSVVGA